MSDFRRNWQRVVLVVLPLLAPLSGFGQEVVLLGRTSISATATDLSGETDPQENGTPQNRLGGHGSAIAWTGVGNRYVMLPDRGPDDGANSYRCRIQIVEIVVDPGAPQPVRTQLVATKLLTSASGKNFVGRATQFDREHPEQSLRFDPEGIRVTKQGTVLISEEYGPSVREFDSEGKWIRDLATPPRYQIKNPGATPADELPPHNTSGRQNNRGWEGVALSDDGSLMYLITQSPLLQDGGLDEHNARIGTNIRLRELNLTNGSSREFLYPLADKSLGCSEVEWVSANRLLVIERDGLPGEMANVKRLYEIDLAGATDIQAIEQLPSRGIPSGVRPVTKRPFLDLLAAEYGLAGPGFPEKIEGIALGPLLKSGQRVLVVTSDNDFKRDEPTEIYLFAVK